MRLQPLIFVTWEEPFQNQKRFSVQNVIFRRISSPEAEQDNFFVRAASRASKNSVQKLNLDTFSSLKKQI